MLLPSFAAAADVLKVEPYFSIQEEYSDNINLTSVNKQSDFITTIAPGIRLSDVSPTSAINLDYKLGLTYFAKQTEYNFISQEANLNGSYSSSSSTRFWMRENFVRSDDPRSGQYLILPQSGPYLITSDRSRAVYWRNVVEPYAEYKFGTEDRLELHLRDNLYRTDDPSGANSHEDYINPNLTYWFNHQNGMVLEYGFDHGSFDGLPDLNGQLARGRYMYRPAPNQTYFAEYIYLKRSFDTSSLDYDVHNPSVGLEYAFDPTLSAKLQIGFYKYLPESSSSLTGPSGEISILKRVVDMTFALGFRCGYYEDFFTPENLGFASYQGIIGNITYQAMKEVTFGLNASLEWADYVQSRNDQIWLVGGNVSYVPYRWLTISVDYSHREVTSSASAYDYGENRVVLKITAIYL